MIREDKSHKPIYFDYIPTAVLRRYGEHMLKGAKKHGSGNFLKGGYPKEEYINSIYRHLISLKDNETNEDHASSIMFNIIGFMYEDYLEHGKIKGDEKDTN